MQEDITAQPSQSGLKRVTYPSLAYQSEGFSQSGGQLIHLAQSQYNNNTMGNSGVSGRDRREEQASAVVVGKCHTAIVRSN